LARSYLTKAAIVWDGKTAVAEELRLKSPFDEIKSLRSRIFAIVPLVVQGQAVGVLAADRKINRVPFEPATLEALRGLATQAALALEHARLYASAQPVLNRSLNLSVVYPAFARAVKALLPYDRIGVIVPEGEQLVMALSVAEPPLASWQGHSWVNAEGTAVDWVLKSRQPRVVRDLTLQQDFPDSAFVAKEGVRATIMVPLLAGGTVVGAFFLDSRTPGAYTERDVDLVDPVAQQLALAIDNTRLIQDIKSLNDTVQAQSLKLADWNATLEKRVDEQLRQLESLSRLKRFFSPQLAEAIVNGGTDDPLTTHRREVVVVFLDLRGFTAFAETSDPEDVMGLLREYHGEMGNLILEHEGTLERFTGDGMMIFFNDPVVVPNPTERALRMAIAMRERVDDLSQGWRKHGHDLSLGIGIAKGFATIGAIGFEGRLDYGAVGIVTNLAARLCSEAKGGQILTSRKALSDIELMAEVETVGDLPLKGFTKPVQAFNIRSIRNEYRLS
jgi:class 3 adenylate cyclase/putative methionine-R-sulfoxide reductase with GAF domain